MEHLVEEAYLEAIFTENRSLYFYRKMSGIVTDPETRGVFNKMAEEEREHLERLIRCYPGDGFDLLRALNKHDNRQEELYVECLKGADDVVTVTQALEIALREEQACIDRYSTFVTAIRDQQLRDLFELTLDETRIHMDMISDEYRRVTGTNTTSGRGTG